MSRLQLQKGPLWQKDLLLWVGLRDMTLLGGDSISFVQRSSAQGGERGDEEEEAERGKEKQKGGVERGVPLCS